MNAILNEIDGKDHDGTHKKRVPNIFGMNFQAVSIGQKLIYQHNGADTTDSPTYSTKGGYLDSIGTPSPSLFQEIMFVDDSIGMMVSELKKKHWTIRRCSSSPRSTASRRSIPAAIKPMGPQRSSHDPVARACRLRS